MVIENKHKYYKQSNYRNENLIEVYKDTLLKATNYPHGVTTIYDSSCSINVTIWAHYNKKDGEVFVENIDTVNAIRKYTSNFKVCALNMASYITPGGGVAYGAKAQEEALFRCSNLGLSISNEYYPLKVDELLYTKNAVFFKDEVYNDLDDGYVADVLTCAAVRIAGDAIRPIDYEKVVHNKIETMLNVALINDVDTLILGAWGCGVYRNDPMFIADMFKKHLLGKYRYSFKRVVFAIINDENATFNNYEIFKSVIDDGAFKD